jgi:hypothetical protein
MPDADLRPMTLGELLDRTFSLYKQHFWLFAGIMALPFLVLFLFQVGFFGLAKVAVTGSHPASPGGIAAGVGVGGLVLVLYLVLLGAAQAATIFAVSDLYLGRAATIRGSYRRVQGKIGRVLLVMMLTGLLVAGGFVLLIIPGIILLLRTAVAVPVAMLEDAPAGKSIRRSLQLTKGHAVQAAWIFLLLLVLGVVIALALQFPVGLLARGAKPQALPFDLLVLQQFAAFLSRVLVGPIGTIAFSLLYYNLRVRKEAFDLEHLMASLGSSTDAGAPSVA